MKDYIEVKISAGGDEESCGIIVALLNGLGYEGFVEDGQGLLAYVPADEFDEDRLRETLSAFEFAPVSISRIHAKNWNRQWESDYKPVVIDGRIMVRAPFHRPLPGIVYDLIIEPRMSFGTAHHETTSMMLRMIAGLDLQGKEVLDMGCGTAVLAILASKMGAAKVLAVDNDEWAYRNASDNVALNAAPDVKVLMGDAGSLKKQLFDLIFANINRNVLLADMPLYAAALRRGGMLLLSGFYAADMPMLTGRAAECGLERGSSLNDNDWMAVAFLKN
jgi:ribosomal protein L11 methyltransferase